MPRKAVSAQEQMDQALLEAIRVGQARRGEKNPDTAKSMPHCQKTFYDRLKQPGSFSFEEGRILAKRFGWTDRQVCMFLGVEYHGRSTE